MGRKIKGKGSVAKLKRKSRSIKSKNSSNKSNKRLKIPSQSGLLKDIEEFYVDDGNRREIVYWIKPEQFLYLASSSSYSGEGEFRNTFGAIRKIKEDIKTKGLRELLFLQYDVRKNEIAGHEGRHRAMAIHEIGLEENKRFLLPVRVLHSPFRPDEDQLFDKNLENIESEQFLMKDRIIAELLSEFPIKPRINPNQSLESFNTEIVEFEEKVALLQQKGDIMIKERDIRERKEFSALEDQLKEFTDKIYDIASELDMRSELKEDLSNKDIDLTDELLIFDLDDTTLSSGQELVRFSLKKKEFSYLRVNLHKKEITFRKELGRLMNPFLAEIMFEKAIEFHPDLFEGWKIKNFRDNGIEFEERSEGYQLTADDELRMVREVVGINKEDL